MTTITGSILIVDDEPMNLDMLSRRLRRSGFAVEVAASGREALDMVHKQTFDLILLDQMMPELSGAEVLRILRGEFSAEELPIVMVTAVAESDKIANSLEAGANDYITKPVDFPVALARIRSQLARKRAGGAVRQSEERYALVAKASQDGLFDWNIVTGAIYFSPRWNQMLGLDANAAGTFAEGFARILGPDRKAVMAEIDRVVKGHDSVLQCGYRMLRVDGSVRWMSTKGIVTRDQDGKAIRISGSQTDVTEEKTVDVLTGLPNRVLLLDQLECALDRACRPVTEALSHAVLLVDLGGSKTINDSLGRQAGIDLLKNIGSRLQATATEYDAKLSSPMCPMAAYMGGDEFAVLLRECATREDLEQFAAHIKHAMQEPFNLEGRAVHCVFSMGMALARASHVAPEDIVHDAAIALSQAKMNGRGEVAVFEPEMQEEAMARLDLENDIRMAAQRNELEVAYQPKVDLKSGLTYGVEALVRWNHPKRGRLQPGAFIPVAEETGAIVEIGRWILEKACGQVRAWHDILPMQPPLELSVNLSPSEFKQRNLVEEIGQALVATSFPASSLHLELTEGVLFEDMEVARSTLEALKRIGLSLDIDDFGTGYSSLKYLRELPFDCIKIDRYFTGKLDRGEPSSGDLIRTIVEMAQNLGMEVIAEGVETRQQCQMLRELGCKSGQGYYFSKPISADAMQSFLVYQRKVVDIMESSFNPSVVAAATPVLP